MDEQDFLFWSVLGIILLTAYILNKENKDKRTSIIEKRGFKQMSGDDYEKWECIEQFDVLKMKGLGFRSSEHYIGRYRGQNIGMFQHHLMDSRRGTHQTVMFIELRHPLPAFILRPEYTQDRIAAAFGYNDINFNNLKLFSIKYYLQGENESEVRLIFNDEVQDFFSSNQNLWIQNDGSRMLVFKRHDKLVNGERLNHFIDRIIEIENILQKSNKAYGYNAKP